MSGPNPIEFLSDPLSPIARAERRNLLIAGTVGLLVAIAGIVPTKISALGIELSLPAQEMFIYIVCGTIVYFLAAFIIYGVSDFFIWRKKYQDYLEAVEAYNDSWTEEDQEAYDRSSTPKVAWLYQNSGLVALIRAFFEYALPVLFGLVAAAMVAARASQP